MMNSEESFEEDIEYFNSLIVSNLAYNSLNTIELS